MTEMLVRCAHKEMRDVVSIVPFAANENRHSEQQIELLARIMAYQGVRNPITVSTRSGFIVSGHGRLLAAKLNGWKKFPVDLQDFEDEAQEAAARVADNAIQELAELDRGMVDALTLTMPEGFDLELLGIPGLELADVTFGQGDPDAVPDVPKVAKTKRGELWLLGEHRLLCGDSTDEEDVDKLMGGEEADMVFTDPPYGVNAVHNRRAVSNAPIGFGKTRGENYPGMVEARSYLPVENDDKPFDAEPILSLAPKCLLFGANYFHDKLPLGWRWVVWDKKAEIGTDEGPFSDCELAWTNLDGRAVKIYRHLWAGLLRAGSREEELKERVHPTQKPVGLCAEMLSDLTEANSKIIDPFLGSGSILIACEKTNRRCFGCEIEPLYCDVVLQRWSDYTGKDPIREDGVTWSSLRDSGDAAAVLGSPAVESLGLSL